jgi:hypothetical protein
MLQSGSKLPRVGATRRKKKKYSIFTTNDSQKFYTGGVEERGLLLR